MRSRGPARDEQPDLAFGWPVDGGPRDDSSGEDVTDDHLRVNLLLDGDLREGLRVVERARQVLVRRGLR